MVRLTKQHQILIRRAREMHNNDIYPCRATHAQGFIQTFTGGLMFWFNTDDNSTHSVTENRLTAADRILQSCSH